MTILSLEGRPLEIALTTANAAAQAWYGYDQVSSQLDQFDSNLTKHRVSSLAS